MKALAKLLQLRVLLRGRHCYWYLRITDPQSRTSIASGEEILIHNKCDLDQYKKPISVSALTGEGLDALKKYLKEKLLALDSQFSSYHISESERTSIAGVLQLLKKILAFEDITLLAEDLRQASEIIASLLGYNIGEDSLNYIFEKMCIGK